MFSFTDVPSCGNVQRVFRKFTWPDNKHDVISPSFHPNHGIKQGSLLTVGSALFGICVCVVEHRSSDYCTREQQNSA